MTTGTPRRPDAKCPIRPGEPCTLCQVSVTGPQDCGLVYLVMGDEELREGLQRQRVTTRLGPEPEGDGQADSRGRDRAKAANPMST